MTCAVAAGGQSQQELQQVCLQNIAEGLSKRRRWKRSRRSRCRRRWERQRWTRRSLPTGWTRTARRIGETCRTRRRRSKTSLSRRCRKTRKETFPGGKKFDTFVLLRRAARRRRLRRATRCRWSSCRRLKPPSVVRKRLRRRRRDTWWRRHWYVKPSWRHKGQETSEHFSKIASSHKIELNVQSSCFFWQIQASSRNLKPGGI